MKSPLRKLALSGAVAAFLLLAAHAPLAADSPPAAYQIVAFKHILSVEPGHTTYAEAIRLLGRPEKAEMSKEEEVAGGKVGGTKIVSYPSRGIFFIIAREDSDSADPVISGIYVESPFRGMTPNGLRLGMPKKKALEICDRDYFRTTDLGSSCFFATERGGDSRFQLWFTRGRLSRMKIFAPLKSK